MRSWVTLLLVTIMILLAGCSTPSTAERSASAPSAVTGTKWKLQMLGTDERWTQSETPWFKVNEEGRLSGSNGCNRLMGEAAFPEKGRIVIDRLASTRMACPDMAAGQRVNQLLENAYRYLIDHDRLILMGRDGHVLGGFRGQK